MKDNNIIFLQDLIIKLFYGIIKNNNQFNKINNKNNFNYKFNKLRHLINLI